MPKIPESKDPEDWHRYFAALCNNAAWELATKQRSAGEDAEMMNLAHASAWHWGKIGNELNRMRAKTLLAEAHALLGLGQPALELAEEVRAWFLGRETDDWEIASGESGLHESSYAAAKQAVEAIGDDEDRRIVMQTFEQVPRP